MQSKDLPRFANAVRGPLLEYADNVRKMIARKVETLPESTFTEDVVAFILALDIAEIIDEPIEPEQPTGFYLA